MEFLLFTDELIWRRSLDHHLVVEETNDSHQIPPIFSQDNVDLLKARLMLWERAVRTGR